MDKEKRIQFLKKELNELQNAIANYEGATTSMYYQDALDKAERLEKYIEKLEKA